MDLKRDMCVCVCVQMIEIYMNRGMTKEDATLVIETMAKYKDFFVDTMMQQELDLQASDVNLDQMLYVDGMANHLSQLCSEIPGKL